MSPLRFGPVLALPCATLLLLAGCAAVPVAQLAAQAMPMPASVLGGPASEVAQASDTGGMAPDASGLQGMLQRVTGGQVRP